MSEHKTSKSKLDNYIKLNLKGLNHCEIAKKCGVSREALRNFLQRRGIKLKHHKKPSKCKIMDEVYLKGERFHKNKYGKYVNFNRGSLEGKKFIIKYGQKKSKHLRKFSNKTAAKIKTKYLLGLGTITELAKEFKVTYRTISLLIKGKHYPEIQPIKKNLK